MKTITCNKLVRDKIPKISERNGKTCITEILSDEEYLKKVEVKLDEEIEEWADLLELIYATVKARGASLGDLEAIRINKAK